MRLLCPHRLMSAISFNIKCILIALYNCLLLLFITRVLLSRSPLAILSPIKLSIGLHKQHVPTKYSHLHTKKPPISRLTFNQFFPQLKKPLRNQDSFKNLKVCSTLPVKIGMILTRWRISIQLNRNSFQKVLAKLRKF